MPFIINYENEWTVYGPEDKRQQNIMAIVTFHEIMAAATKTVPKWGWNIYGMWGKVGKMEKYSKEQLIEMCKIYKWDTNGIRRGKAQAYASLTFGWDAKVSNPEEPSPITKVSSPMLMTQHAWREGFTVSGVLTVPDIKRVSIPMGGIEEMHPIKKMKVA
jgi:hypothetical protein